MPNGLIATIIGLLAVAAATIGFLVAVGSTFMLPVDGFSVEIERILPLLTGATMIVGVMLFDDLVGIPPLGIAIALLALGTATLDTARAILYRTIRDSSLLNADRVHLHHRLLDAGWSQRQIVTGVATVTPPFGILSLALPTREARPESIVAMGVVLLALIGWIARRGTRQPAQVRYPYADL